MADYANIATAIGELKRAAIDSWMKDQMYSIDGDRYSYDGSGRGMEQTVDRPGADGEGGGNVRLGGGMPDVLVNHLDDDFMGGMDTIRSNIDNAMKPWLTGAIKDPGTFDSYITEMVSTNTTLALNASSSGGSAGGGGSIAGNIKLVEDHTLLMTGRTMDAFNSKFSQQLRRVVGGYHALTVVLGGALSAEKKMWQTCQQDVANIVEAAKGSFNAHATTNSTQDWGLILGVAGVVVGGVTAFATSGASVGLAVGTGIKLLEEANKSAEKSAKEPTAASHEAIMKAFTQALTDLDGQIAAEEQALASNLDDNTEYVRGLKGTLNSFDLDNKINHVDDDSDVEIHINQANIDGVCDTFMPAIATSLKLASQHNTSATSGLPWRDRDPSLGMSSSGPYTAWCNLAWMLDDLIDDLEWEVTNGAKTLKLVIEDMGRTDTAAKDALEKHAEKVKAGSPHDPYN